MSEESFPELSVVIVTPDGHETIPKTERHLHAQTARKSMEIFYYEFHRERHLTERDRRAEEARLSASPLRI